MAKLQAKIQQLASEKNQLASSVRGLRQANSTSSEKVKVLQDAAKLNDQQREKFQRQVARLESDLTASRAALSQAHVQCGTVSYAARSILDDPRAVIVPGAGNLIPVRQGVEVEETMIFDRHSTFVAEKS